MVRARRSAGGRAIPHHPAGKTSDSSTARPVAMLLCAATPVATTVRPPRYDIGRRAAALLLAALEDGTPLTAQSLPWELLPRGST